MKKKSGFTLSEVLITLTLIGIITTLTIPSLVASTDKSKKATTLKKAYNTISGAYTQALTAKPGITNLYDLTNEMVKHLNVKYYVDSSNKKTNTHGILSAAVGDTGKKTTNWIVTEDGIGYQIYQVSSSNVVCTRDKVTLVANAAYNTKYCYRILIDIDGPLKGDSAYAAVTVDSNNEISSISGSRFYVYATKQGLTAGNKDWTGTASTIARYIAAAQILEAND